MTVGLRATTGPGPMPAALTGREADILCLLAHGLTNWQIARELLISQHTVAQHVAEMLRRCHARSRCELVARAYSAGVLQTGVWPPRTAAM
jgi:DNA-binding NarL/FixJ family response regulator